VVADWYLDSQGNIVGAPPSIGVAASRKIARSLYDEAMAFCYTTEGCQAGEARIKRPDQKSLTGRFNGTVSEGMGYALRSFPVWGNPALPADLRDDTAQSKFNACWRWVKRHLNSRGLCSWTVNDLDFIEDVGAATDGDWDIWRGLHLADLIWGSNGEINYAAEAAKMLKAIKDYEITPANHATPNELINGDTWGNDNPTRYPDYLRPAFMRSARETDGDSRWATIIDVNYALLMAPFDRIYNTGMVPDVTNRQAANIGQSYLWSYNAIRHPLGLVEDAIQYPDQAPELARKMPNKMAAFAKSFTGGDPGKWGAEWDMSGRPTASYVNLAFVSTMGVSTVLDSGNSVFNSACLQWMSDHRKTDKTYFGLMLSMICSITMSGLDQRYTTKSVTTADPVALSFRDTGSSLDTAALLLPRRLAFVDQGTSSDRASLRITASLAFTDTGTSSDRASLSVDGAPAAAILAFRDVGTSSDKITFTGAPVSLALYDRGVSSDTASLSDIRTPVERPIVGVTAEEMYAGLAPFAEDDEATGWHLLHFVDALTTSLQETDLIIRESSAPGWATLVNADETPVAAIPWLGQFVGVDPAPDVIDEEGQRLRLKEASGFARGTPAAIRGAARQALTGRKRVQLFERDGGDPYRMRVVVFASEAPNIALTRDLVMAAKPAGVLLQFVVAAGMSYDDLKATGLKYSQLRSTWPTYDAMRAALPAGDA
jgi:endo-1,4-beta-D-glucanase Y